MSNNIYANSQTVEFENGIQMYRVDSSFVNSVGYDKQRRVLAVHLCYAKRYYADVDETVYQQFLTANSKGRFFNQVINNKFQEVSLAYDPDTGEIRAEQLEGTSAQKKEKPPGAASAWNSCKTMPPEIDFPLSGKAKPRKVELKQNGAKRFLKSFWISLFAATLGFGWNLFPVIFFGVMYLSRTLGANENTTNIISWAVTASAFSVTIAVMTCLDIMREEEAAARVQVNTELVRVQAAEGRIITREWEIKQAEKEIEQKRDDVERVIKENSQRYPWLANAFADYEYIRDKEIEKNLRMKARPAIKAAEQVSAIAREKRQLTAQNKMLEYQLNYYETLFPWLEEFKEIDPKEGAEYVRASSGEYRDLGDDQDHERDAACRWISPEEYQDLSIVERNQRALDRYMKRKKSDWEVGIEYERYIGYLFEQKGYKVKYTGATLGLEDMGRDLIATDGDHVYVVQCKRWAKEKTIHEKHVFQLYGTTVLVALREPRPVKGVFVTTTKLSDIAKDCAEYLNIKIVENLPMKPYPMIKCNVSQDGEKIYHLPFDQQYDKVRIKPNTEERYALTVAEAESFGFRRAFRWKGANGKT